MDERREKQMIQQAFETSLSGLQDDPWLAQRVLSEAKKEGEVVMKKKISVALIVTIMLILFSAVAVAAALLWQDYAPQVKQAEHELGDYVEWPDAQRIKLAKDLLSMGYVHDSEATAMLVSEDATEAEKARAADQMMLELTGLDDVKEIHSAFITYAILGHEDTWTPEQRVWWNGIVTMYGDGGAVDTLIVPTADDLPEEDAIAIAKAAVAEAYGFDDAYMAALHPVANLYVTDARPDYKRWDIQLKLYREGSTTWAEKIYTVIVDENGEVIADPDVGIDHPAERAARANAQAAQPANTENPELEKVYKQYGRQVEERSIWSLSLEEKAALLGEGNGMPSGEDLTDTEAVAIARKRLASIGYDLTSYAVSVWYKISDSNQNPFYVVYWIDDVDEPLQAFCVTIDAVTGEVLYTYTPGSMISNES